MSEIVNFLYYSEDSPTGLRWSVDIFSGRWLKILKVAKHSIAGSATVSKHYEVTCRQKKYYCHRVVWQLNNGEIPEGFVIDHIDGNGLNNNICNLRAVPHRANIQNSKVNKANKSGVCGVFKFIDRGVWYWIASWNSIEGKAMKRRFNINKLGNEVAFTLACAARRNAIDNLNKQGQSYTERHGT